MNANHFIKGIIVDRRSLGRKCAFADIALFDDDDKQISSRDGSSSSGAHSASTSKSPIVNVIFVRQRFGDDPSPVPVGDDEKEHNNSCPSLGHLDQPFPTKTSHLPFGARVTLQLGHCQKVPSNIDRSKIKDVWEVSRWKVEEHPHELAEQFASLEVAPAKSTKSTIAEDEVQDEQQQNPSHDVAPASDYQQQITMGVGAMSNSKYLKARREAYQYAKQHGHNNNQSSLPKQKRMDVHEAVYLDESATESTEKNGLNNDESTDQEKMNADSENTSAQGITKECMMRGDFSDCHHGGKQAKVKRAKIFASWVLDTFFEVPTMQQHHCMGMNEDASYCQPCNTSENGKKIEDISDESSTDASRQSKEVCHVLDVAGGKGQLSLELMIQQMHHLARQKEEEGGSNNVPSHQPSIITQCTIIDPMVRKGDAKYRQSKLKRTRSHLNWLRQQQEGNHQKQEVASSNSSCLIKESARCGDADASSDSAIINHLATYFNTQSFPQLYSQCCVSNTNGQEEQQQKETTEKLLLFGLHPDQCTEDILDVALSHNISVAIVPCCVYPDLFPSRRMMPRDEGINSESVSQRMGSSSKDEDANINPVRSYDDFLQYLMDKDDGLQIGVLPFEGKNKVIYKKAS